MRVSIIVPIYNEVELIPELCQYLVELNAHEVIIVDGYSSDNTWASLNRYTTESLRCIQASPGRAHQMNTGAAYATGELLLFLHADTRLPADGLKVFSSCDQSFSWGRFNLRFDQTNLLLSVVAVLINLRSRWTSICTGDQSLFVRSDLFFRIGGFAPITLMEDIDLCRRLKRIARPLCLKKTVETSSRRWRHNGVWRTIMQMWCLRLLYWLGTPASSLAKQYKSA